MSSLSPRAAAPRTLPRFGLLGFGLIALELLLLQIVLSRFFAATLTYYFAFMLVSLAMLGLAAGGLAVRVFPRLMPEDRVWERASALSLLVGVGTLLGILGALAFYPHIAFENRYNLTTPWALAGVFWCLFPPFLFGGIIVSGVLSSRRDVFHRLYAVDLGFAAAGCVIGLLLLEVATPVEVLLTTAPLIPLVAAVLFALEGGRKRLALIGLAVAGVVALTGGALASNPARAKPPHLIWTDQREVVSEWNATSAVRVYFWHFFTWALSPTYKGPIFPAFDLIIDGLGGTPIVAFDGKVASLQKYEYLDYDLTALPHHLLATDTSQVIIGPGGGVDVLQAVRAGGKHITAVEINPLIERIVNHDLAAFSGAPYRLPGVRTVIENGRTFIKRAKDKWDLITLTWVDTGGSATALAFSENYLYTADAFREYLQHLNPGGMVAFLRAWNPPFHVDTMRGVSVAVHALMKEGVQDPGAHILIAASGGSDVYGRTMGLVLTRRTPFTPADVANAQRFLSERQFTPIWLPGQTIDVKTLPPVFQKEAAILHGIITTKDRETFYRDAVYDIAPATDDNPFYFVERAGPNRPAGMGIDQLRIFLGILSALVFPFLVIPALSYFRGAEKLRRGDLAALGYFALLGLSFMLVEIEFFHLFALMLGKPTLTFALVLCSLLVSSGLGSLFGEAIADGPPRRLIALFAILIAQLMAFSSFGSAAVDSLVGQELGTRIFATVAIVAPIGFCMGMPLAAGMRLIHDRRDLVLWGWAINGALSVFASLIAIYLSIHYGIGRTFAIGCVGYLLAGVLVLTMKANARRAA